MKISAVLVLILAFSSGSILAQEGGPPAGSVLPLGPGCTNIPLSIAGNTPVPGGTFTVSGVGPPGVQGGLFASLSENTGGGPGPFVIQGGPGFSDLCTLHLNPFASSLVSPIIPDGNANWSFSTPVITVPMGVTVEIDLQALFFHPATGLLVSDGLRVTPPSL